MSDSRESKKALLAARLNADVRREAWRATLNKNIGIVLVIGAITTSFVGGIAGITGKYSSQVIGAIALIPGALATLSTTLKFDRRAWWHYRKKVKLDALARRLEFELPSPPTDDQIARISADRTAIDEAQLKFEKELNISLGREIANHDDDHLI